MFQLITIVMKWKKLKKLLLIIFSRRKEQTNADPQPCWHIFTQPPNKKLSSCKSLDVNYLDVLFDLGLPLGIHLDLWGDEGGHRHKLQVGVANQLPACQYENIKHRTKKNRAERHRRGSKERITLYCGHPTQGVPTPLFTTRVRRVTTRPLQNRFLSAVLRIHDILGWIWIRGSMPLTNGSGYFRHWPSICQQKNNFLTVFSAYYFLKLHLHHFSKIKSQRVTK